MKQDEDKNLSQKEKFIKEAEKNAPPDAESMNMFAAALQRILSFKAKPTK